jgi:hypothetical protein
MQQTINQTHHSSQPFPSLNLITNAPETTSPDVSEDPLDQWTVRFRIDNRCGLRQGIALLSDGDTETALIVHDDESADPEILRTAVDMWFRHLRNPVLPRRRFPIARSRLPPNRDRYREPSRRRAAA